MSDSDTGAQSRRRRRTSVGAAVGGVAGLSLAAFIALVLHSVQASNARLADGQEAQATVIARLSASLDTTRQQLQQHGVTPSAPPAQSIVQGVPGVPGTPGAQGVPGSPGVKGDKGDKGDPGSPAPVITPSPGASGAQGVPGKAGINGVDGLPGKDGKDGAPGKDGTNGRDGADGQPPAGWSWTWTDQLGTVHTYSCVPVDGFDPAAPRYTCSEATTAPTSPASPASKRSGLLGVGMMALSASYRRL